MIKRKKNKKIVRMAPLLLCCTIIFSSINLLAFSDSMSVNANGLCSHHPEHTVEWLLRKNRGNAVLPRAFGGMLYTDQELCPCAHRGVLAGKGTGNSRRR